VEPVLADRYHIDRQCDECDELRFEVAKGPPAGEVNSVTSAGIRPKEM
jgi:hypothetical protein